MMNDAVAQAFPLAEDAGEDACVKPDATELSVTGR